MFTCKIDDTPDGAIFNSLQEIADFLGVTKQYVTNCKRLNSDKDNHFWCRGYPITILSRLSTKPEAIRCRQYYKPKGKPMTSKLKCPFCGESLRKLHNKYTGEPNCDYECGNVDCDLYGVEMPETAWQALIQSQKDLEESQQATLQNAQTVLEIHKGLEIARKALEEIAYGTLAYPEVMARETLELIENK